MRLLLLWITLFIPYEFAYSQIVDIQAEVNKKVDNGPSGVAKGSWDRRTGNTDLTSGSGSLLGRYKIDDHLLLAILKQEYGTKSGEKYLDSRFHHIRYRYAITDLLTAELFGQEDFNKFRGYISRHLVGAGPLFKWIDEKHMTFFTGIAYMQEHETLSEERVQDDGKHVKTDRASVSVAYQHKVTDSLSLSLSMYYQPNLEEDDYRLSANSGASFSITDSLSYTLSASITEDTAPPEGIKPRDMSMKNGLKLAF